MLFYFLSTSISMTLDSVTWLSRFKNLQKAYEIRVNAPITIKVLAEISFHVMAEDWKCLKDTLAFSSFTVC